MYNVLISAAQQSDSALSLSLSLYIYIVFFVFFPIVVYHRILIYSSLHYIEGLCCLSTLYIIVHSC